MQKGLKAFFVHFFVTVFFVVIALAYFHPVLQGKVIEQSDIIQFTGMAKEQNDFRNLPAMSLLDQQCIWGNANLSVGCLLPSRLCEKTRSIDSLFTEACRLSLFIFFRLLHTLVLHEGRLSIVCTRSISLRFLVLFDNHLGGGWAQCKSARSWLFTHGFGGYHFGFS